MSIKAMNWAWEQVLPPSPKLILMALADAADDSGECWPKVKTIARKCCVSERTVQRVMKDFIAGGLLEMAHRFSHEGRQVSNKYRLLLGRPDKLSPSKRDHQGRVTPTPGSGVSQLCRGEGDIVVSHLNPPLEHSNEPLSGELSFHAQLGDQERGRLQAMLAGFPQSRAQGLLDLLGNAIDRKVIHSAPEKWLGGVIRRRATRDERASTGKARHCLNEDAYREELVSRGLSADVAAVIAAKTIRGPNAS